MNITEGRCTKCDAIVFVRGDGNRWYACDHDGAPITASLSATLEGVGGVRVR